MDPQESIGFVSERQYSKRIFAKMNLHHAQVEFQLDYGAIVNILSVDLYKKIFKDPEIKSLESANTTLIMFNKSEMKAVGKVNALTTNPKKHQKCHIVDKGHKPLLGAKTIQELNPMIVNKDKILSLETQSQPIRKPLTMSESTTEYKDVFTGEGKLPEKLHLEIDDTVPAVKLLATSENWNRPANRCAH